MQMKVRVRGVDQHIRTLSRAKSNGYEAAVRGVLKAAKYLLVKVKERFGKYQSTGGEGGYGGGFGGSWKKLQYNTIARKLRKYGVGDKPLFASGRMKDSFSIVEGGKGTIAASVGSDDPKLVHHVYGAPKAGVPRRDPIRVTAFEEMDNCTNIIEAEIREAYDKL